MRVLSPTSKNPFYKFAHMVTDKLGVAGATLTTGAVTLGGPAAAGMFMAPEYFIAGAIAIPAFLTYEKYKGKVKENARLNLAYQLRRKIGSDYYPEVDAVIAEIFACEEKHAKFEPQDLATSVNSTYYTASERKALRARFEKDLESIEAKKAKDHILTLGNSCEYCGQRLQAIELLSSQSKTVEDKMVDSSRLNNLLEVVEQHRLAKEEYDKVFNRRTAYDEVKELTSGR